MALFSQVCVCVHTGRCTAVPGRQYLNARHDRYPNSSGGYPSPRLGYPCPELPCQPKTGLGYLLARTGPPGTEQQSEYLLRGGRYASCVHTGGLSWKLSFEFNSCLGVLLVHAKSTKWHLWAGILRKKLLTDETSQRFILWHYYRVLVLSTFCLIILWKLLTEKVKASCCDIILVFLSKLHAVTIF